MEDNTQNQNNIGGEGSPVNPAILEAFDGDLEDLVAWSTPVGKKRNPFSAGGGEDRDEDTEAPEEDGIERQRTSDGREVEWFNIRAEQQLEYEEVPVKEEASESEHTAPLTSQDGKKIHQPVYTGKLGVLNQNGGVSQIRPVNPIDVNDPHYENYKPDPYYEYGIGPEPKRPGRGEEGNGVSGLAVASMCCGIGGLLFIFCGYGIPMAVVSLVFGIITVSRKNISKSGKAMAIVGISLSAISLIGIVLFWIFALFA